MMKMDRKTLAPAISAAGILLISSAGYHVLADKLDGPHSAITLPAGLLNRLELNVPGWTSEELKIQEAVIDATDTDDHISRIFREETTGRVVVLFVGYGLAARDLLPHRPEVCYPSAGWVAAGSEVKPLDISTDQGWFAQIQRFHRGALNQERVVVANYYLIDGDVCPDVSGLRAKAASLHRDWRYIAQVLISCAETPIKNDAEEVAIRFASHSAAPIKALLEAAVASASGVSRVQ
jgi:hypothetical protein